MILCEILLHTARTGHDIFEQCHGSSRVKENNPKERTGIRAGRREGQDVRRK